MTKLTVTVAEAAALIGVSRRLIYNMVARGELRSITLGRRIVIPTCAIEELLGQRIEVSA